MSGASAACDIGPLAPASLAERLGQHLEHQAACNQALQVWLKAGGIFIY